MQSKVKALRKCLLTVLHELHRWISDALELHERKKALIECTSWITTGTKKRRM